MAICVLIFGPSAVGKMTVGYELSKRTNLKLLHNHATIELLLEIFPFQSQEFKSLNFDFRDMILRAMAKSSYPGLIFTMIWSLGDQKNWDEVDKLRTLFQRNEGKIYLVELAASLECRLSRNTTELRLARKPSKRNLEWSESNLKEMHRLIKANTEASDNVKELFQEYDGYLKLHNEAMQPEEAAAKIIKNFNLL